LGLLRCLNDMNARNAVLSLAASLLIPAVVWASPVDTSAEGPGDAREASCSVVLGPELDGRFFVYNTNGALVSELFKPGGRTMELTLEPGTYDVVYQREPSRLDVTIELAERERKVLERDSFQAVEQAPAPPPERKASEDRKGLFLRGRTRVEFFGGFTDGYVEVDSGPSHSEVNGGQGGMAITHWLSEEIAADFQFVGTDMDVQTFDDGPWETTDTHGSWGMLFGARYYFPKATLGGTFRPYAAAAIGPFSEFQAVSSEHHTHVHQYDTKLGGQIAGGVDFQINRLFSLGVKLGVLFREDDDPSFGTTFGFGLAWGKGHTKD
jgi:hypothetical protein